MCKYIATIVLLLVQIATASAQFNIINMTVDFQSQPLGIDNPRPLFGWAMQSEERGADQKNYRIVVADEQGRTCWDSGIVRSSRSQNIAYEGETLQPATRYRWTLAVTDHRGRRQSASDHWETGLMTTLPTAAAWNGARWIGGDERAIPMKSQWLPVFRLHYRVTANGKATFYYGANDERLMDANKNILGVKAGRDSSYIAITTGDGRLTVKRQGYGKPLVKSFPLAEAESYDVKLSSVSGSTNITVNGHQLGNVELNPVGRGGDYTGFPMLADIGYGAAEGVTASFADIAVKNYRSPSHVITTAPDTTITSTTHIFTPRETGTVVLGKTFNAHRSVSRARLYATSLGCYDLTLNGRRVNTGYLNPGLTQYNKTLLYQTYDITPLLREGDNRLEAQLYEGWWSGALTYAADNWNHFGDRQALRALLHITYDDGSEQTIVTDPSWQYTTEGAVTYASLFMGETYDARREHPRPAAWRQAEEINPTDIITRSKPGDGFDAWPAAMDYSQWRIVAQADRPVTEFTRIKAKGVTEVRPGVFVYDLGQNIAGTASFRFNTLRAGQRVKMRYAEVLYPDMPQYKDDVGMVMMENMRLAMSQDEYISNGREDIYQPRGTFHGFRYIEITGIDRALPPDAVEGVVLSSIDSITAGITTSDTLVNRFVENVKWSLLANTISIPSDCPQRNERMGWSGDLSVFSPTMSFLFQADGFMRRHLQALRDTQRDNGAFADVAPVGGGFGGPLWQSVGIVLPWQMYRQYGDVEALRRHYPAMQRYMQMLLTHHIDSADGHYRGNDVWSDLGDWLGIQNDQNDNTMLFDCYLAYELRLMSHISHVLGFTAEAVRYEQETEKRRQFINAHYFDADGTTTGSGLGTLRKEWTGPIGSWPKEQKIGTQTSYAVPLALGIVNDEMRAKVAGRLNESVVNTDRLGYAPYSLLTGFVGTPWITFALSDTGHSDTAYRLLTNTGYPSWLYSVTQGATTIWERMDSYTTERGFGTNNYMNSFNHYAFGSVVNWLMQRAAGIRRDYRSDENKPAVLKRPAEDATCGFRHFVLAPIVDTTGSLTHIEAYYDSPYGRITSAWWRTATGYSFRFTIPANTSATLCLPGKKARELKAGHYEFAI